MSAPSSPKNDIHALWLSSAISSGDSGAGLESQILDSARIGMVSRCMSLCAGEPSNMALALQAALRNRRLALAAALLEAGAEIPSMKNADAARLADGPSSAEPFSGAELWRALVEHSIDAAALGVLISAASSSGRLPPSREALADIALSQFNYALMLEILESAKLGVGSSRLATFADQSKPDGSSLSMPFFSTFAQHNGSPFAVRQQEALAQILFDREPSELPALLVARLWHHAIGNENRPMIAKMAAAGHFPETWACPEIQAFEPDWLQSGSFLARALLNFPEAAKFLSQIPSAVADARARPPAPEFVANLQVEALAAMARLGIDISTKNEKGQTFLHLWARDSNARPGWPWVAKNIPALLVDPDSSGSSPIDIQRCSLANSRLKQERFDAMIAGFERSAISKAVGLISKTSRSNPPKGKPRL